MPANHAKSGFFQALSGIEEAAPRIHGGGGGEEKKTDTEEKARNRQNKKLATLTLHRAQREQQRCGL
jgi:hypothetical protein